MGELAIEAAPEDDSTPLLSEERENEATASGGGEDSEAVSREGAAASARPEASTSAGSREGAAASSRPEASSAVGSSNLVVPKFWQPLQGPEPSPVFVVPVVVPSLARKGNLIQPVP